MISPSSPKHSSHAKDFQTQRSPRLHLTTSKCQGVTNRIVTSVTSPANTRLPNPNVSQMATSTSKHENYNPTLALVIIRITTQTMYVISPLEFLILSQNAPQTTTTPQPQLSFRMSSAKREKSDSGVRKAAFVDAFKPLLDLVMDDIEQQYPVRFHPPFLCRSSQGRTRAAQGCLVLMAQEK